MKNAYKLTADIAVNPSSQSVNPINTLVNTLQGAFVSVVKTLTPVKTRKVVVFGSGKMTEKLAGFFNSEKSLGYKFMGAFDVNHPERNVEALKAYCREEKIDEIYFTRSLNEQELINDIADFADSNFIYFRIANNELNKFQNREREVISYFIDEVPVIALRNEPLSSRFNQIVKRGFDIVFSLLALAFLVPFVFPFIALAIKLESRGPIFFVQKRPGYKNQLFGCFKFRSMTVNNDGAKQATKNDKRITKVGAFLRKTSLDELPQFINVLLGDMSVVGPRPNMVNQLEQYSQIINNYSFRHFVKPGITGLAQVNGFRGETDTLDKMEKRVEFDLKYMETWSLWLDIKIVFLTVYNIVKGEENAY
jgi:putative colanic acid biosysnthesis UDP-glucose lipid carrier transferase